MGLQVAHPKGTIACDLFIYVDDCCVTGATDKECWKVGHVVGSLLNYLGIQDCTQASFPFHEPWGIGWLHSFYQQWKS